MMKWIHLCTILLLPDGTYRALSPQYPLYRQIRTESIHRFQFETPHENLWVGRIEKFRLLFSEPDKCFAEKHLSQIEEMLPGP